MRLRHIFFYISVEYCGTDSVASTSVVMGNLYFFISRKTIEMLKFLLTKYEREQIEQCLQPYKCLIGGMVPGPDGKTTWKWRMERSTFDQLLRENANAIVSDYFSVTGSEYTGEEILRLIEGKAT